jgi:guanylate kinase
MADNQEFLEHAIVFGKHYGTSKIEVQKKLDQGIDVVLEIDWQGAQEVRRHLDKTVSIFILPPSKQELERRIVGRNQDAQAVIKQRLEAASNEIKHYYEYNYLVVNDDFDEALDALRAIILATRSRQETRSQELQELLTELTGE